jgi:hypothetical protein
VQNHLEVVDMELSIGAKMRVPHEDGLVIATITAIEPLDLPDNELGWAIHLVADPPVENAAIAFPLYGELSNFTIEQIETRFEQQLKQQQRPQHRTRRPPVD